MFKQMNHTHQGWVNMIYTFHIYIQITKTQQHDSNYALTSKCMTSSL